MMQQIILKKGKEESLLRFHPWVFSGAIQRLDEGISEGDIVRGMPMAPMNTKASNCFHCMPTSVRPIMSALSSRWRVRARSLPASLICMMAIFCISVW